MSELNDASRDGCLNDGFFSATPSDLFSLAAIRSAFLFAIDLLEEPMPRALGDVAAAARGLPGHGLAERGTRGLLGRTTWPLFDAEPEPTRVVLFFGALILSRRLPFCQAARFRLACKHQIASQPIAL